MSAGIVLGDTIDRPLQDQTEVFGQSGGLAPVHLGHRVDVREAVAQKQDLGIRIGLPERAVGLDDLAKQDRLLGKEVLFGGQLQHHGDVAQILEDDRSALVPGVGRRTERNVLLEEDTQPLGDMLHRCGCPVRIGLEELRLSGLPPPRDQLRRGIEDEHTRGVHLGLELRVGGVLEHLRPAEISRGKPIRLDHGLDGRGHQDKPDARPCQLPLKAEDRRARVRMRRCGVFVSGRGAMRQPLGIQKARSSQIIHAGTIEEPAAETDVGLLVPLSAPAGEGVLDG